jgi:hypothetical protein
MKLKEVLSNSPDASAELKDIELKMMKFNAFLNDALDLKCSMIQIIASPEVCMAFFGRERLTKSICLSDEYAEDLVTGLFHRIAGVRQICVEDLEIEEAQGSVIETGSGPIKISTQVRQVNAGGFEFLLRIEPHLDFLFDSKQIGRHPIDTLVKENRKFHAYEPSLRHKFGRGLTAFRTKALALLIADKKRLAKVCGYLADSEALARDIRQMEKPLFESRFAPPVISQDEKTLADRMIMIAQAYGFRLYGSVSGGSLHFHIDYPEYRQVLRIYVFNWPSSVEMHLETIQVFDKEDVYLDMRQQPTARYQPMTPKDEIITQFVACLEKSQAMRADFLAGGRKG